jgi:subfamily B ATP-binding cassette protein MsbA
MSNVFKRGAAISPYFRGTAFAVRIGAVAAAVAGVCEAAFAWLMLPIVDGGFQYAPIGWLADIDHSPLWFVPIGMVAVFALRGVAVFIVDYSLAWTANQGIMNLRLRMFGKLLDADPNLFASRPANSLTNTIVYESAAGVVQLTGAIQTILKDSFSILALLATLLMLNWKLTLVLGVLAPVLAVTIRAFGQRLRRITKASQTAIDRLGYVVEENVLAWRIVRLHGLQTPQAARFRQESRALNRLLMKSTVASASASPLTQLFTAIALATVVALALWQSSSTGTPMGSFVAFIAAAAGIANPIRRLTDVSASVARGMAAIARGIALIDDEPSEAGGPLRKDHVTGHFSLRDVTVQFGPDGTRPALAGLTLEIEPGSMVALVGPSGAGKSTLANLLPRFLSPSGGVVELDGVPLPDWDLQCLRAQVAMVSQDVVLFNGSIEYNVCLDTDPDPQRLRSALQAANLLATVDALPHGLQTLVGHNGTHLSGGQRQRLAIARAIYKNASVVILDEATSALDSESERLIQQAMERLMAGRTSIVIAHRLSTIAVADKIVVLEAGRVVEEGSHAQLLDRQGLYAKLHSIQFGAFSAESKANPVEDRSDVLYTTAKIP